MSPFRFRICPVMSTADIKCLAESKSAEHHAAA